MIETKKNPQADLTSKGRLFFNIGLVISLLLVVFAFEARVYDIGSQVDLQRNAEMFEELLDIKQTVQPPPPAQKKIQPKVIEVPDEVEINEDIEIDFNIDMNDDTSIEDIVADMEPKDNDIEVWSGLVETQPEPLGGMAAFYQYVQKNLKYPAQARRMGIEGKVFVQFVVDKDGSLINVKAVKGIGAGCNEEAVRVIKNAPKWKPGKQRGREVKVKMILPIIFKLG